METIGAYFGGLESIAYETLNWLIALRLVFKLKETCVVSCLLTEIKDVDRVYFLLFLGDILALDPPNLIHGDLL